MTSPGCVVVRWKLRPFSPRLPTCFAEWRRAVGFGHLVRVPLVIIWRRCTLTVQQSRFPPPCKTLPGITRGWPAVLLTNLLTKPLQHVVGLPCYAACTSLLSMLRPMATTTVQCHSAMQGDFGPFLHRSSLFSPPVGSPSWRIGYQFFIPSAFSSSSLPSASSPSLNHLSPPAAPSHLAVLRSTTHMRLLHVDTRDLHTFYDENIPPYAILSHTWDQTEPEVTYEDMKNPDHVHMARYDKIEQTCQLARATHLKWVWIDTCCIDKSSSAELSEAINSMFRWYQKAVVCYAHLEDVKLDGFEEEPTMTFALCRWFSRGWTLQELLAPPGRDLPRQDMEPYWKPSHVGGAH